MVNLKTVRHLQLLQLLYSVSMVSCAGTSCCPRFYREKGPLVLNDLTSSDVIVEQMAAETKIKFKCLSRCSARDCAAVSILMSSGICQLLFINDASQTPGPPASHVGRTMGLEAHSEVWVVEGFHDLVRIRRLDISFQFSNSSTGRSGSIQQALINVTGCYRIEAAGAKGGDNSLSSKPSSNGAKASGSFNLTAGTELSIVIGQMGGNASSTYEVAGGGGGSFVYKTADNHLLVAAGGGGGASSWYPGTDGQGSPSGSNSFHSPTYEGYTGYGGTNGQPGFNDPTATAAGTKHGGCGAGWLGKAANPRRSSSDGERGGSQADGWHGGSAGDGNTGHGGFGGGGGGGASWGAGGAGGGFSGGGAGLHYSHSGGGGGSYCSGSGCTVTTSGNTNSNHGFVILRLLSFNACL